MLLGDGKARPLLTLFISWEQLRGRRSGSPLPAVTVQCVMVQLFTSDFSKTPSVGFSPV